MKKLLSLLLAVMMVISLCPITALADEVNPIELQQVEAQEEQQEAAAPLAKTAAEVQSSTGSKVTVDGAKIKKLRDSAYSSDIDFYFTRVEAGTKSISVGVDDGYYLRAESPYFGNRTYASEAIYNKTD